MLGPFADDHRGLNTTYAALVARAFEPRWWRSDLIVVKASNGSISFVPRPNRPLRDNEYTLTEYNFSLFFGLSVQLYEMTLISDDAPIDRFFEGQHQRADRPGEARSWRSSTAKRRIRRASAATRAPSSPTTHVAFSTAPSSTASSSRPSYSERMFNGACEVVAYDQGTYNLGIRPTEEDRGQGNNDPFGNPLSFIKLLTMHPSQIPSQELLTYPVPNIANPPFAIGGADADRRDLQGAEPAQSLADGAVPSTTAGSERSARSSSSTTAAAISASTTSRTSTSKSAS